MPKVRAVEEMNDEERRAELVSTLAEGVLRYAKSGRFEVDRSSRQNSPESDTACLELSAKPGLSVTDPANDR